MTSTTFKRFYFGENWVNFRQNHSCDILPRIMINTHTHRLKIAELTISWLFWEISYSNYDDRLNCYCEGLKPYV